METLKLSDNMISVSTKSISDQYLQDTYKDGRIDQLTRINADLLAALEASEEAIYSWVNEKNIGRAEYTRRAAIVDATAAAIAKAKGQQ